MTLLKNTPLGQLPKPHNWEFANAAARTGLTGAVAADVGKFARQLDDDTNWMLTNHSPVTWAEVGASGDEVTLAASATTGGMSITGQEIGFQAATDSVNGYLTSADHATFDGKSDGVTLADSAISGGLSLVGQEIGNQAASAGTPVAAAVTSLGDVDTGVKSLVTTTWAEDTWWASGTYVREIFRHDGGTTWTSFVNASDASNGGYDWHVWHNGELWTGITGNPSGTNRIWSFNPDTEVWTGRGGDSTIQAATGIGVWDSTVVVGNLYDYVYKYISGTTWESIGKPGADRVRDLVDVGGTLFARDGYGGVFEYSGSGTVWANTSVPEDADKIINWNGVLVAACRISGSNIPLVYKYEASTWTQLGSNLAVGASSFFSFLAADSSGVLYAQPSGGTTVTIHKYDSGLDSWSSAGSYASANGQSTNDGVFNPSDVAGFGVGYDEIKTFQDDHYTPINGYLTSEDWRTFNAKADALAGVDGELITWDSDGNPALVGAGTATHVLTSNGAGAAPTFQAGGSGGLTWQRVTASTTATSGNGYLVDAASNSVSISLPASPSEGDIVAIQVYDAAYTVLVNRNTKNIEGATFSPALGKGDSATFVYAEATEGWVRVGAAGGTIHATVSSTLTTLDTFTDSVNGAAQYMYYIANAGTNFRSGTVRIHWDGVNNLIEKDETSVTSIGDTSDFVFTADIDTGMVRLRGDADASYSVRLVKTMI